MKSESVIRGLYDREWNKESLDEATEALGEEVGYEQCQAILGTLDTLRAYFEKYADSRKVEHIKEVRKQMERMARENGVSLEDLFAVKGKRAAKGKPKSKGEAAFRNPDDPTQTWTGKGKRPTWLKDKLEQGVELESMKI